MDTGIGELRVFPAKCLIGITAPRPVPKLIVTIHAHAEEPGRWYVSILFRRTGTAEQSAKGVRLPVELPTNLIHLPLVAGDLFINGRKPAEVLDQLISMVITLQARVIIELSEDDRNVLVLTVQIGAFETSMHLHRRDLADFFEIA